MPRGGVTKRDFRKRAASFRRLLWWTTLAVYFLILVGAFVRVAGAGMGCPDWPRCFGRWVPPTSEEQLPPDYQETYADHGYGDTRFNVTKTWIEYLNRLVGVSVGLLIIAVFVRSLRFWRVHASIPLASFGALVAVGIQGWLGAVLVDSNLADWSITIHFFGALVVVCFLVFVLVRSRSLVLGHSGLLAMTRLGPLFALVLLLSLVQIVLGTEVRDEIDEIARAMESQRELWIGQLGLSFAVHRSFSIVVVLANLLLYRRISRATLARGDLLTAARMLLFLLVLQALSGVGLAYLGMPTWLQPLHPLLAMITVGLQFGMWTMFRYERTPAR